MSAARDIAFGDRRLRRSQLPAARAAYLVATFVLGAYGAAMALQFTALCVMLVRDGISPFAPNAPAAFFTNFLVCGTSALAIWALGRIRPRTRASVAEINWGEKYPK